jgi:hypothetical protein
VALVVDQLRCVLPPLGTLVGFALNVSVGGPEPACTVTVAERCTLPPGPVHDKMNVRLLVMLPIVQLADATGREPLQDPEAAQLVALVVDQLRCVLSPLGTLVGFAVNVRVGAGGGEPPCTVTLAERCTLPPAPVHDNVNVRLLVMLPIVQLADAMGREPLQDPDAVQLVALVVDQRSCVLPPLGTLAGFALNVSVGAACVCKVTVAAALRLPLALLHVSV